MIRQLLILMFAVSAVAAGPSLQYNPYTTNSTTAADARVVVKTNGVADLRGSQKFTMQTTGGNYNWSTTSGELRLTNLVNLVWYEFNDPFRMGSITDSGNAYISLGASDGTISWTGVASGNGSGITNLPSPTLLQTNLISGGHYTNGTGRLQMVRGLVALTPAAVVGGVAIDVRVGTTIAAQARVSGAGFSTLVTTLLMNYTNDVTAFIPSGSTYCITNTSSGAGNASAPVSGTFQLVTY